MTLQGFLDELAKTPRRWGLSPSGAIRCIDGCPLMTVFGTIGGYTDAARDAGLTRQNILRIINAADGLCATKTRARLLKACGL